MTLFSGLLSSRPREVTLPTSRILLFDIRRLRRRTVRDRTRADQGANPITGEGLPNPAPKVTRNWGELPAGRKWGTSAGLDVDPKDGNIWGYERCGAGTAGGGPVDCENNPVDPVFKFDRHTGKVLANIGKGVMVTPHGIHVDKDGNVWIADFAATRKAPRASRSQVQPEGREAAEPRHRRQAGQCRRPIQPTQRRRRRPDGSIYVSDGHDAQGMTTNQAIAEGLKRGATSRISKFTPTASSSSRGDRSA
jgi:hypothetical protein